MNPQSEVHITIMIMINNDRSKTSNREQKIPTNGFIPKNHEQARCHDIATAVGDAGMGFVLYISDKYGIDTLERAYGAFRESLEYTDVTNKPAYFNGIVKNMIEDSG